MSQPVLFIHGAGRGAHEADSKLATSLQKALGSGYRVICPPMPNEGAPEFDTWKAQISKELAALDGPVILVGHSLGASVLLKYLSEVDIQLPIAGIFLIAAPYWGAPGWQAELFALRGDFAAQLPQDVPIFLYHGRADEIVPFTHLALYVDKLPQATIRVVDGQGHQFSDDLSIVAADIVALHTPP